MPSTAKLPVFGFHSITVEQQAKYFIDINSAQKPVSPDLIWDLESEMRPQSEEGRIALTAKSLNEREPVKDRIAFPLRGRRQRGQLHLGGVCEALKRRRITFERTLNMTQQQRNGLYAADPGTCSRRVSSAISQFLLAASSSLGEARASDFLYFDGGLAVALAVFELILVHRDGNLSEADLVEFGGRLSSVLTALYPSAGDRRSFRRGTASEAGRTDILRQIVFQLRTDLADSNFAPKIKQDRFLDDLINLERRLSQFVLYRLDVSTIDELKRVAPEGVWKRVQELQARRVSAPLHELFTFGEVKDLALRGDNFGKLKDVLLGDDGFPQQAALQVALDVLVLIRNNLAHGLKTRPQDLGMARLYHDILRRALAE